MSLKERIDLAIKLIGQNEDLKIDVMGVKGEEFYVYDVAAKEDWSMLCGSWVENIVEVCSVLDLNFYISNNHKHFVAVRVY